MNGRRAPGSGIRVPRPTEGRVLGGVCAGLADRHGVDPTLLRLAVLLLCFASGLGLVAYGGLWLAMPDERSRSTQLRDIARENLTGLRAELAGVSDRLRAAWRRTGDGAWPRPLGRRWMAIALIAGGALILLWSFGAFAWLTGTRVLGLAAVVVGAAALISLTQGGERR